MRYDVEADWTLLHTCNYRCEYCFFPDLLLGQKMQVYATPEEWQAAFEATGRTWLIHMTGGEPTAYSDFTELCARLSSQHYLSLNSNLSLISIKRFSERIEPGRVNFINAAVHPLEREQRKGWSIFLNNVEALLSRGFPLMLSVVATPEALAQFEDIERLLSPTGMVPIPKILQGFYRGRNFPSQYTPTERHIFRTRAVAARKAYGPLLAQATEQPSISLLEDDQVLNGLPVFDGHSCAAGQRFVSVTPTGEVFRCGPETHLGSLLKRTLRLSPEPRPCDSRYCYYFCKKYSSAPAHAVDDLQFGS